MVRFLRSANGTGKAGNRRPGPKAAQAVTGVAICAAALVATSSFPSPVFATEIPPPVAAVAQVGTQGDGNDPLEPVNRAIFAFNEVIYGLILKPISDVYELVTPEPAQKAVTRVLENLRAPVVLANDLLQGEGARAWQTAQRFAVNTTVGVGGLFDPAEQWGIRGHDEDFGQTMATWGVGDGPYLVLPLFGPSNGRDAVGRAADFLADPWTHLAANTGHDELNYARAGISAVDTYTRVKPELARLKATSVDYYAAVRSVYRQKRAAAIRNSAPADAPTLPDLQYGEDTPKPAVAAAAVDADIATMEFLRIKPVR